MANVTFERDSNTLRHNTSGGLAAVGTFVSEGLEAMGPLGRRMALTAFGAVIALSLGAATASAFRLPSEITDPTQPQDQALAQTELPSEAAARAYALENPPTYTVAPDRTEDALPTVDASTIDPAPAEDTAPTRAVAYTGPSDETPAPAKAENDSASPTTATTTDANDAG